MHFILVQHPGKAIVLMVDDGYQDNYTYISYHQTSGNTFHNCNGDWVFRKISRIPSRMSRKNMNLCHGVKWKMEDSGLVHFC